MKRFLVGLVFTLVSSGALAQWQIPGGAIPLGRGPGVIGFNTVAGSGGAGTKCLLDTNPPSFAPCFSNVNGTLTITPPALTTTQGLVVLQTTPNSGSFSGLEAYNIVSIVDGGYTVTGSGIDSFGYINAQAIGLKVQYSAQGNTQIRGALAGAINAGASSPGSSFYGVAGSAYANVATAGNLWGSIGFGIIGPSGSTNILIGLEAEMAIDTGGAATYRVGVGATTQGPVAGTSQDAAFMVSNGPNHANNPITSAPFKTLMMMSSAIYGAGAPLDATADLFKSDAALTIANVFPMSNVTVTGNFADFPNFGISGVGKAIFGLPLSSLNAAYTVEVSGVSRGFVGIGVSTNTITGSSFLEVLNSTSGADLSIIVNEASRTTVRYGLTLGNYTEISALSGNGLVIGANNAAPLIFGTNNLERGRIFSSGCVAFGTSGDCSSAGIVNLGTGLRIANAATTGNVLRGDGTNFVSATLAGGDVTGAALTKTDDTNVTLTLGGSPTTALLRAASVTVGWTGNLAVGRGGTGIASGTSGGIPYFSGTTTIASSALLTLNGVVYGGGAGAAPLVTAQGAANSVLTANAGAPSFSAAPVIGTSVTTPIHYGGSAVGSTATISGTSNGSPASAYVLLQSGTAQFVGIGNAVPKAYLDINENLVTSPGLVVSTSLSRMMAANAVSGGMEWVSYNSTNGAGNILSGAVATGTAASPTATGTGAINQSMFNLRGYGTVDGTTWAIGGIIIFKNSETWSSGHQGTGLDFYVTPNATAGAANNVSILQSGCLAVSSSASGATDCGLGGGIFNGQLFMPNITTTSAAQTGTLCWTTGTGKFTADTTAGCLTSLLAAKNVTEHLTPDKALALVSQLDPFAFRYKSGWGDSGHYEQFGLGAEQVALIDERMVGRDPNGQLQGVRYQELTAVLAGAIKGLQASNDNLRDEIKVLKRKVH